MIAIPLSYRLSPEEIKNVLRYSGAKALIFDSAFKTTADRIDLDIDKYIIGSNGDGCTEYERLLEFGAADPDIEIKDDTLATLGFTSGTTGIPKSYLRTHYANFLNHICYTISFDMTSNDISLNAVPPLTGLSWDAGIMLAKGTVINIDFDPALILKAIEKYRVTIMYGVPAMFSFMMAVPDFDRYDLSSLRAVASVGSVLPQPTLEKIWEKITPNVYDHIGLQETGFLAVSKPDMKRKKPAAVGPPTCFHELRIVDEKGREKPAGEVGELIFRYPDGAGEYWRNPEKTQESLKGGWFHSGDLAKIDEDGHLYVVGRVKDMIVTGGYNVFAIDVENVLMTHPEVADCAVIGLPDETWGEKVAAVIKLAPGKTASEDEFISFCKQKMAGYKAPKSVFFDDIPRTPTGKAIKFELVNKYSRAQS
jgi:acyl-CoA synthetase (AMP-forming)/AMP-acid ligase II